MSDSSSKDELRRAMVNDPHNAELRYLFGAEMAQERDYDGAVLEWTAAVALNPQLHIARLQLGLLHLTMARPDRAQVVLAPLEGLDDSAALKHFKRGLEALMRDDFAQCIVHLRTGIELNKENEPLNRDMSMLMNHVAAVPTADAPAGSPVVRTDFSLYSTTKN